MRQCNCSGHCGPPSDGLTRRNFIGLVGAGTAAVLASPAWGAFELPANELERWKRSLFAPAAPRVYLSDRHTDARMHLGGIGTGNFEIGADGRLTTWQLFNTLRDGEVPFYFAVKAGATAKLLQTTGGPDWPRVKQIEMTGEYPFATLRFRDDDLPVKLELTAFTPFAPLDTQLSSMPLAVFVFRIQNPTAQPQTVSLAALMTNPIGYDARGKIDGVAHPNFGGNVNEFFHEGPATGLLLRAEAGQEPTLDVPVFLFATANLAGLNAPPPDRPENLKLEILDRQPLDGGKLTDPAHAVIWLEEAGVDVSEPFLRAGRAAVQAGATLVFSGKTMPLLSAYAAATGGQPPGPATTRPDILFEDFEHGYGNWTVEGEAFGQEPAHGTLANQQPVSGFVGKGLVNSFRNGDDTTGRLTSKPFTIERSFIRFLVGGGRSRNTAIRLLLGGKVVRTQSGKDNERLEPAQWDVREFAGQTARLEIVDEQKGGWGHVNVDQIEFSDQPGNAAVMALLEELLPARFSGLRTSGGQDKVEFADLQLRDGAKEAAARNGLRLFTRSLGKGNVVLAAGPVLDPAHAEMTNVRQRAYGTLCALVGANYVASEGQSAKAPGFGTLALATLGEHPMPATPETSALDALWSRFARTGTLTSFDDSRAIGPTPPGRTAWGALTSTVTVPAGGTAEVPFLLAWHYPNKYNGGGTWMGCHYATRWSDARAVIREAAPDLARLREQTARFRRTFYDSTLPWWLLDCVTANAAILRHIGVVFRIANADTYGWEGSNGCCQPTCTHVWGYEQSLSRLFPDLERDMRRIDFQHQQSADGGVNNRTDVPSPPRPTGEHPFADGHASCILKAYREALNSPDESFFKEYWPHVHRAVDYLIGRDAQSHGGQPAGYLEDDQWNTYDEALHGVTTFISGYYLAALRAGEEWARRMGDAAAANRFQGVFEQGRKKLIELCWNGEYFQQHLPGYEQMPGEVGPGCMADQLIGQWWAHQLGLGYLLPKDQVQSALRAVFKYNFKTDLTGWRHEPRAFAGAKDKGLIICTWPKGGRPGQVMLYSDEVWTGIEYQVAAHLIYEGMIEEGFAIVKAARDRYDGLPRSPIQRNPWNEIECGGHYARAMSSWSLLPALSGYEYDGPRQRLRFGPRHTPGNFKSLFCGPEGWGSFGQKVEGGRQQAEVALTSGTLAVQALDLALAPNLRPANVTLAIAGRNVPARLAVTNGRAEITPEAAVVLKAGESLAVTLA